MSSTSQQAHTHSLPTSQRASLPPLHKREYSSSHRPGSSMSISSMLGTDTDLSRIRPSLPLLSSASQSSPAANGSGAVDDFRNWHDSRNQPRGYPIAPLPPYANVTHTEPHRFVPPLASAANQSPTHRSAHNESNSPTYPKYDYRRTSISVLESQSPMGQDDQFKRSIPARDNYDIAQEVKYTAGLIHSRMPDRRESPTQSPIKPSQAHDDSRYQIIHKPATSSLPPTIIASPSNIDRPLLQQPHEPRSTRQSSSPELSRHHRENGLRSLQDIRRESAGTPDPLSTPRGSPLLRRSFAVLASGMDDTLDRRMADILSDDKRGRASPLPQAVQGAQAQSRGPTNEPGIKNEFARMFSGIGSGVGSAVSTPVPQEAQLVRSVPLSPLDVDDRGTPLGKQISLNSKTRDSSRPAKRMRLKEDDVKREDDVGLSLGRTLSGRGQKRTRNNYQNVSAPHGQRYV